MAWTPKSPLVATDCIIRYQGGIVLVERKYPPPGWAIPGGMVEIGETVEQAVRREMKEETNLELENLKLFGVYSDPKRDPRFHVISIVYTADGVGELQGGDDARLARVFKLDELPEEIPFDHREIITDYISRSAEP
jgi:ADP-ribose pyrophosphatase YjhB (NUDIX family)